MSSTSNVCVISAAICRGDDVPSQQRQMTLAVQLSRCTWLAAVSSSRYSPANSRTINDSVRRRCWFTAAHSLAEGGHSLDEGGHPFRTLTAPVQITRFLLAHEA